MGCVSGGEVVTEQYYVEIINRKTGEVVKSMGPMSGRTADRVFVGALMNLNHDEFRLVMREAV